MKNILVLYSFLLLAFTSCDKAAEVVNETPTTGGTLLHTASFASAAHPTSGTLKVYEKDNNRIYSFENFKSDNGPDLKVYLSEDTKDKNGLDIGKLKAVSGNFEYSVPKSTAGLANKTHLVIWCKAFSVTFGHVTVK
jgi:hypothetical protein